MRILDSYEQHWKYHRKPLASMSVLNCWEYSNQLEHWLVGINERDINWIIEENGLGKDYGLLELERWAIAFKKDVVVICKWCSLSATPIK